MPGLLDMRPRRRLMPPYLLQDEDYGADESQRPMGGLLNAPPPADQEMDAPEVPPALPQGILGQGVAGQSYRGPRNPAAIKLDALRERALELTGEHKVSLLRNIMSRIAGGLAGAVGGGRAGVGVRQEITGEAGRHRELERMGVQGSILQGILQEEQGRQKADLAQRNIESEITERGQRGKYYEAQATVKGEPALDKKIDEYTNEAGQRVLLFQRPNGETYEKPYGKVLPTGGTPTETDKWVKDYLATNNMADTPPNRQKARGAYIKETKTDPAMMRVEGFAETRGPTVTDKKTGLTAPMSWADYNRLSKAEPGRYVAPQYDPETQTNIIAWRDLAKGKTRDQLTSYDTFLRHAGDLHDAVKSLENWGTPFMNKPLNWWRANVSGDPRITAFLAKMDPVQKEFQSFLLNNRALYSEDRETASKMFDENMSPAQMLAVLPSLAHTGDARLQALNESFKRATGEEIPGLYSEPSSRVLAKMGVQRGGGGAQPAPEGTVIELNGQRQIKRGGKWVPFSGQ